MFNLVINTISTYKLVIILSVVCLVLLSGCSKVEEQQVAYNSTQQDISVFVTNEDADCIHRATLTLIGSYTESTSCSRRLVQSVLTK